MPVPMNLEAGLPGLMAQQTHMMAPMDLYDSIWGGAYTIFLFLGYSMV